MDTLIATWLVRLALVYFVAGTAFAFYFVLWGVTRVDPSAREGSWGFKLLIVPGVLCFWPLLLTRLLRGQLTPPLEQNSHRRMAEQRIND